MNKMKNNNNTPTVLRNHFTDMQGEKTQHYQKRNFLDICILLLMFAKGNGCENSPPMLNSVSVAGQQ